jgi:hypothetical protein
VHISSQTFVLQRFIKQSTVLYWLKERKGERERKEGNPVNAHADADYDSGVYDNTLIIIIIIIIIMTIIVTPYSSFHTANYIAGLVTLHKSVIKHIQ